MPATKTTEPVLETTPASSVNINLSLSAFPQCCGTFILHNFPYEHNCVKRKNDTPAILTETLRDKFKDNLGETIHLVSTSRAFVVACLRYDQYSIFGPLMEENGFETVGKSRNYTGADLYLMRKELHAS